MLSRLLRWDGWENLTTGLGNALRDRSKGQVFTRDPILPSQALADMFRFDDIVQRLVALIPREAFRRPLVVSDPALEAEFERLKVRERFTEAWIWGRLYGAGMIVLGLDGPAETPAPARSRVHLLEVYDRRAFERADRELDPRMPNYGEALTYRVTRPEGGTFRVHRSRVILFGGALTGRLEREANGGFDDSIVTSLLNPIKTFHSAHNGADLMLSEASQGVMKVAGLVAKITSIDGRAELQRRAELMDLTRGLTRSIMLDADRGESFEKVDTSFTDIPETMDRQTIRLAAGSGIPVTILAGKSPAGLNATGDNDVRAFYGLVDSERQDEALPRLLELARWIAPEPKIAFAPLWEMTDPERAELENKRALTDEIRIRSQVLTPELVLRARVKKVDPFDDVTEADYETETPALPQATPAAGAPADPAAAGLGAPAQGVPPTSGQPAG